MFLLQHLPNPHFSDRGAVPTSSSALPTALYLKLDASELEKSLGLFQTHYFHKTRTFLLSCCLRSSNRPCAFLAINPCSPYLQHQYCIRVSFAARYDEDVSIVQSMPRMMFGLFARLPKCRWAHP